VGKHGKYRALVAAACLAAGPAAADCRLALALGVDVSRSVSDADYEVQRQGLIAALTAPEVRAEFFRPGGFVALAIYEWSGERYQDLIQPWVAIKGAADLDRVTADLAAHQRLSLELPTGMGEALSFGRKLFANVPFCTADTLDISGDGQNDEGREPGWVYRDEDFGAILVNGLPIGGHEDSITDYYRNRVIHGPGAFVEPAPSVADYPAAIRRKLLRELTEELVGQCCTVRAGGAALPPA